MKIYLAGTTVSDPTIEEKLRELFIRSSKLHSYYHCQPKGFEHKWWVMNKNNNVDLFLDSGAFSAFTQNIEIDIQEYIAFIKEHEEHIEVYANLDVIGDAQKTWKNQRIMERAGLNPIPCFHYGEDWKWLDRYVERNEYIALGGIAVKKNRRQLYSWLDTCFSDHICGSDGMPKVKVHGFGITSHPMLLRYPWYSVDSTSWVVTGRLGGIYVPRFKNGKWTYDEDSWKIDVSNKSPSLKVKNGHIDTVPPEIKKILLQYVAHKGYSLGKSEFKDVSLDYELKENEKWAESKKDAIPRGIRRVEIIIEIGICNTYQLRDEMNIIYFLDLEKAMPKWPCPFKGKNPRKLSL